MRTILAAGILVCFMWSCTSKTSTGFAGHFLDETMRIDYFHTGDAESEEVEIDAVYRYGTWAGSLVNLIDTLDYGAYYYNVYDAASDELLFSRGFDSYFKEYQTSSPAREGQRKQFHESAIIPFPKSAIRFALDKRNKNGTLEQIFTTQIDPSSAHMLEADPEIEIYTSLESGDPHFKADIAIIAEGYTMAEQEKFRDDLERFTGYFFQAEPCKSHQDRFNIRGVFKASQESGADEPRAGITKNTAVGASFNTMGSERYMLTEENKALRDIAGHAPYDAIYIMVNHDRYGGGGIYNFYCVYSSDNVFSDYLMVHEFGHSFFGLADEYYTSSTAYNDFYPAGYEPAEPNITALNDPENIKWKHLLTPGIEIPTPWEKAEYDSVDVAWQARRAAMNDRIAELKRTGASEAAIDSAEQDYEDKSLARHKEVQTYLENSKYAGKVGAFEGAGYTSTGLYRGSLNCIMFTRTDYFCPVCKEAMTGIIEWYSN
jgi:hypothetical protein